MLKKSIITAVITLLVGNAAMAATGPDLVKHFQDKFPQNHLDKVLETPVPGVYELDFGREVTYATKEGRYLFFTLIDTKERKDLTAARKMELSKIDFSSLPLGNAIKDVHGNGKRTLVVFSDPDCPFCAKQELEIEKLTDITVYTFEMPIVSLHPNAKRKAINIWCDKDQPTAWKNAVSKKINPQDAECQNPIDANIELARKLMINGTPTLVAPDGRLNSSVMSAAEIDNWLKK